MNHENTIVTIADRKYFWGAFLLAASIRKAGMTERILLLQSGFSEKQKSLLKQFGNIRIEDSDPSGYNHACRKPEALLLAETEYLTWVDSDGFFTGNVSKLLPPDTPTGIQIRLRSDKDNGKTFAQAGLYGENDVFGTIPEAVLKQWRQDVGGNDSSAIRTCASACILSVGENSRPFLKRWGEQMKKVLPKRDVGVTDRTQTAYRQLDESVLNSLLAFLPGAPVPDAEFRLDKDLKTAFRHVVGIPKPWQLWTPGAMGYYDEIMEIIDWTVKEGLIKPGLLPNAFQRKYTFFHRHGSAAGLTYRTIRFVKNRMFWK